ncbi:substrate-binding domain-containing protein [Calothrix sp. UHCC 0171]|uniref:substrate-binding domain-containing protein n=1 Tax=Calothrix sp. UHCC 0171 TaxID=3110245 RepID=UPI002B1F15F7|nr:substrate-binding domain-containing protein [Calothrix sp. UHCC 0171]MEA5573710.1 substrate-binding domain-containing protein [Calothrix sp. UHCC 0171]
MKQDANLYNNIKSIRTRLGLSQQDLANIAGVTRQTISGVESRQYTPSVAITLRLAKALGCKVEDLFWFEQDLPEIEAVLSRAVPETQKFRVSIARVSGQWIAYPLVGKDAFRTEMIAADGEAFVLNKAVEELPKGLESRSKILDPSGRGEGFAAEYPESKTKNQTGANIVRVRLLDDVDKLHNTVVIAGCAPVISLWARATEHWHPQLRVNYTFANSMAALHSLCRGEVHIAGMHLYDSQTGEHNVPFAREILAGKEAVLITLGIWEEGLLVPPGNPMGIQTVADLASRGVSIANREPGAGSRIILEQLLEREKVPLNAVKGFDYILHSHQDVAKAVVSGIVNAGVSTASIADIYGLGFVSLHHSRYDLVILKEYLQEAPVQQLLGTLGHRLVRSQFEILGGYDTSRIGEVVANI